MWAGDLYRVDPVLSAVVSSNVAHMLALVVSALGPQDIVSVIFRSTAYVGLSLFS